MAKRSQNNPVIATLLVVTFYLSHRAACVILLSPLLATLLSARTVDVAFAFDGGRDRRCREHYRLAAHIRILSSGSGRHSTFAHGDRRHHPELLSLCFRTRIIYRHHLGAELILLDISATRPAFHCGSASRQGNNFVQYIEYLSWSGSRRYGWLIRICYRTPSRSNLGGSSPVGCSNCSVNGHMYQPQKEERLSEKPPSDGIHSETER